MPDDSASHLRQPDDLVARGRRRLLALRPCLAAGVLLSSDAGPSIVSSVRATCVPGATWTVTALTSKHLSAGDRGAGSVAASHSAAASEQRDADQFFDGHVDRLTERERTERNGGRG